MRACMHACVRGEGTWRVYAPSAQFSCENETALKNMLLKRKREKNHQVLLISARYRRKYPQECVPLPASLLPCLLHSLTH